MKNGKMEGCLAKRNSFFQPPPGAAAAYAMSDFRVLDRDVVMLTRVQHCIPGKKISCLEVQRAPRTFSQISGKWLSLPPLFLFTPLMSPRTPFSLLNCHMSEILSLVELPVYSLPTTVRDVSKGPRGGGVSKGKSSVHTSVAVCPCPSLWCPCFLLLISVCSLAHPVTLECYTEVSISRTASGCQQTPLPTLEEDS